MTNVSRLSVSPVSSDECLPSEKIRSVVSSLWQSERFRLYVSTLRLYADQCLSSSNSPRGYTLFDPALNGAPASCCTQSQFAAIYALHAIGCGGNGIEIAAGLLFDVANRQKTDGGFAIPYNRGVSSGALVDVAEIGAAADSLYLLSLCGLNQTSTKILRAGGEYVLSSRSLERSGAVYKNSQAKSIDVLNGDVYGALALARAYSVSGDARYLDFVFEIVNHLLSRRRATGVQTWWPYAEDWKGITVVGNSLAYQATIIAFGRQLTSYLDDVQADSWSGALQEAMSTVLTEMGYGVSDGNEFPSWSRDWENVWEIYLALSGDPHSIRSSLYLENRLSRLDKALSQHGADAWNPGASANHGKSAITSTFRKSASFSGALVSWITQRISL